MNESEIELVEVVPPPTSWRSTDGDPSDEVLIQEIVQRRAEALCSLYARYKGLVITVASNVLLDPDDAQETLQDVFLLIWNHAERFDARRGKVKGWISGMTHYRAIDHHRRRRKEAAAREAVREELTRNMNEHFSRADRAGYFSDVGDDGRALLLDAVARLPPERMQVLLLTYMAGMSQREIARHLGLTVGVVKHRLNQGMRTMAKMSGGLRGLFSA